MKLLISLAMPEPQTEMSREEHKCPPVEDQVREALELIDSGYKSDVEWVMINKLYKQLKSLKKPNDRAKNLISMIEPVIARYGYHGVEATK